jgi:hypothetical protein
VDELIYALLVWLEDSALGEGLRESGVWTYAWLNLAHILGIGTLLGTVLVLDLRLLGAWRSIPVAVVARPAVPLAAAGFALAVVSGATMITVNAVGYAGNPFLYAKLPLIGLALVNVLATQRLAAWQRARAGDPPGPHDAGQLAVAGGLSLILWLAVIACGRMIGYW